MAHIPEKLNACDPVAQCGRGRVLFMTGAGLILSSYVLWAGALVCGALALRGTDFPWGRIALGALATNWVVFILGILLAGPGAARYVKRRCLAWLHLRKNRATAELEEAA